MKRAAAILIAVAAVIATFAMVSMDRSEAATSPAAGMSAIGKAVPAVYGSDGSGIWVSGEGTISVAPDIAHPGLRRGDERRNCVRGKQPGFNRDGRHS